MTQTRIATSDTSRTGTIVVNPDGSDIGGGAGAAALLKFKKDAVDTFVSQDTAVPANTVPLPVVLYGLSGQITVTAGELNVELDYATDGVAIGNSGGPADFGSGAFSAQTLRVVIATDQPLLTTNSPGITIIMDVFATVGVVSSTVLTANLTRLNAIFVNDSPNVIYLARGNPAVVGSGIRINPNGGSYEINSNNLFKGTVDAISTVAGSNLTVSEGI